MTEPSSPLAKTLLNTSRRMELHLQEIRDQNNHSKIKGDRVEEHVREFLRQRLPQSVGVTSGEIIDANGKRSREVDVIVYDAMNSPLLFAGDTAGSILVPAEAVIAAVEVKSKLRSEHVSELITHCRSIKSLSRTAYCTPPQAQGTYTPAPIHYSVFAFESDGLYHRRFNQEQSDLPVDERIDTLTAIDRGFVMHIGMDWEHYHGKFYAHAGPNTVFGAVEDPSRALMFWYGFLCTIIGETERVPMSISPYMAGDLRVNATLQPDDAQRLNDSAAEALARQYGLPPDILRKVSRNETISEQELQTIQRSDLKARIIDQQADGYFVAVETWVP